MTVADDHDQSLTCPMSMAERELGAFMSVVTDLYGPEQAKISAEDWIDELELVKGLAELTTHEWRRITMAAAVRLANRLNELTAPPGFRAPELIHKEAIKCTPPLRDEKQIVHQ